MKNLMNKIRKSNKGFTLVELIIVIAIIAVLTAVAAPQYIKWVEKGREATDDDNAAILLSMVQVAVVDNNSDTDSTNNITSATLTMNGTNTTADGTDKVALAAALEAADKNYAKMKRTSSRADKQVYTITVTSTGVTGVWSAT